MFYGHVHNGWEYLAYKDAQLALFKSQNEHYPMNSLNVGAMMPWMNLTPRSFQFCMNEMQKQQLEVARSYGA